MNIFAPPHLKIGAENRSVECYYHYSVIIIIIIIIIIIVVVVIVAVGNDTYYWVITCSLTIHFKFITKCDSLFYYKVGWSVITMCNRYYKVRKNVLIIKAA